MKFLITGNCTLNFVQLNLKGTKICITYMPEARIASTEIHKYKLNHCHNLK